MTEAVWLVCDDARELRDCLLTELNVGREKAGQRKLWLFACASCRLLWDKLIDERSRAAVEYAERLADGLADPAKFHAVFRAAEKAANTRRWREDSPLRAAALDARDLLARRDPEAATDARSTMRMEMSPVAGEHYQQWLDDLRELADLVRDVFGNPFRPATVDPTWNTPVVTSLARAAYDERALPSGHLDTARLAVLADALEEAGCSEQAVLDHLRRPGPHVRGCWPVDLLLARE